MKTITNYGTEVIVNLNTIEYVEKTTSRFIIHTFSGKEIVLSITEQTEAFYKDFETRCTQTAMPNISDMQAKINDMLSKFKK